MTDQEQNPLMVNFVREEHWVVPLRDMVVFPHMMAPFIVGRASSVVALEKALESSERLIFLVAQRDPRVDEPLRQDLHDFGVVARVVQNLKMPNGNIKLMVEGVRRGRMAGLEDLDGAQRAVVETYEIESRSSKAIDALKSSVLETFEQYAKASHHLAFEGLVSTLDTSDVHRLADSLATHLLVSTAEKQELLETHDPVRRLQRVKELLDVELEKINIDKRINVQVKKQMEKAQKEYYLNEKIKAIHQELGRKDERGDEIQELKEKIEKSGMNKDAREKADAELKRLEAMPPVSAEATVSRNYIEWLLAMPWRKKSRENRDLRKAQAVLDEDHYGLEKIKERILEFLAVRQLAGQQQQSSILCFAGPPGVGKSSLAKSIARATGRKFVRLSLGGVRDEAEIRGHRRTYIGAFPGQIIQMMKKAGTTNPVFLLDEIDKMAMDFRGDPSAALMEVLDPEQNTTFVDHYLDVEYDLSKVLFIATANVLHTIPGPLRDRTEIIQLSGYTLNEKLAIGRDYLVTKQLEQHGLSKDKVQFEDEALARIVESYTREAGVRNLEREIARVCRKLARKVVEAGAAENVVVTAEMVSEMLGPIKYRPWRKTEQPEVGVATGMAWTEFGGELLETEVSLMPGKGKLTLTGQLGDVMQESARAAVSYLRSRAELLGVDPQFNESSDLHLHVPEGAIPKDGPSAGITMATALISALTRIPVRKDVAMTGEVTLRGKVLPIGGVKEKLLAAFRAEIREIVLPRENEKDLEDIPDEVRERMEIHLVESMDEVLSLALDGEITPLPNAKGEFGDTAVRGPVESGSIAH